MDCVAYSRVRESLQQLASALTLVRSESRTLTVSTSQIRKAAVPRLSSIYLLQIAPPG
jgi:hypothetical protein